MGNDQPINWFHQVEGRGNRRARGHRTFGRKPTSGIEEESVAVESDFDAVAADLVGGTVNRQYWPWRDQIKAPRRALASANGNTAGSNSP